MAISFSFSLRADAPAVISNSGFSNGVFQTCAPIGQYNCMRVFAGRNGDNYLDAGGGCANHSGSSTFYLGDVQVGYAIVRRLNADDRATFHFPNGRNYNVNGGSNSGGNCETGSNHVVDVNQNIGAIPTTFTVSADVKVGGKGEAWGQMDVYFQPYLHDFGDAPDASSGTGLDNYRTRSADNGPSHRALRSTFNVYLGGSVPDDDSGNLQNTEATADDLSGGSTYYGIAADDENGVTYPSVRYIDSSYSITADATNTSGSNAYLYAWFDFDKNGSFDVDELITNGTGTGGAFIINSGANNTPQTLTWNSLIDLTANGYYFSRVRISSTLLTTIAVGSDEDSRSLHTSNSAGEVEDYKTCVGCVDITGHVYNDVNGDGDLSDQVAVNGVTVYIYTDNGDNIPNAADGSPTYTTTTDANGYYSFLQIPGVTYFVSPNPPSTGAAVAEQTYTTALTDNVNGTFVTSYCDANGDAIADVIPINTTGVCFGGWDGDRATNNSNANLSLREHISRIVFSANSSAVNNLDFGFSYNVVTNINNSAQGSLSQFITNANTISGANEMRFVPAVPANDTNVSADWWVVTPTSSLTTITGANGANTTLDGTAYSYSDGITIIDSNSGNYSASQTVGSNVGCSAETIPALMKPELQIDMATSSSPYSAELVIINADNSTIKNMSLTGGSLGINIYSANITDTLIENNLIGIDPAGNDDVIGQQTCGTSLGCAGIAIANSGNGSLSGDNGIIRNNAIKTAHNNISLNNLNAQSNTVNWQIIHNQLLGTISTAATPYHNIVISRGVPSYLNIQGNLLRDVTGDGINQSLTSNVDLFQTVISNDIQQVTGNGIHYRSGRHSIIECNVLQNNGDSGVSIDGNSNVHGYLITKNSFNNNNANSIDLQNGTTGDGVSINNDLCNNNTAAGANNNLARPQITSAVYDGTNLTLQGNVCSTGEFTFEVYKANAGIGDIGVDAKNAGEGEQYLYSISGIAGSVLNHVMPIAGLVNGDEITVIAQRVVTAGLGSLQDTSEFSANVPVDMDIVLNGKVFEDNGQGGAVAHDGIQNGDEQGLDNFIVIAIYDDVPITDYITGQEIDRVITKGDGHYTLTIPVELSQKNIKLIVISKAVWVDISESDMSLITQVTNNSLTDSVMLINATAGDNLENLDFGKVKEPILQPDNYTEAQPNLPIVFSHNFYLNTDANVSFNINNINNSSSGYINNYILYQDVNCSGQLDSNVNPIINPIIMNADTNTQVCLLVKVMMSDVMPLHSVYKYQLNAQVDFNNSIIQRNVFDNDTIVVNFRGSGELEITKTVKNITQGGDEVVLNMAEPGDVLEYKINFINSGLGDISDIKLYDSTPEFTDLSSIVDCSVAVIPVGLSCNITMPNGSNIIGYEGGIIWELVGSLSSGSQGEVIYRVKVK